MADLSFNALRDRLRAMDAQIDDVRRLSSYGLFRNWTPAVTGSVTNPNLGATGYAIGRYVRLGDLVFAEAEIAWAGAGAAAGSGNYSFSIPFRRNTVATSPGAHTLASLRLTAPGAMAQFANVVLLSGATTFAVQYPATWPSGGTTTVGAAAPWAFGASSAVSYAILYEAAPY